MSRIPAVVFWGVRGAYADTGAGQQNCGGDTACVELRSSNGTRLILDAGTGIIRLGEELAAGGEIAPINILLSHFHWDHIQGLPFFLPLYEKATSVTVWADETHERIRQNLTAQMEPPFFPIAYDSLAARPRSRSLEANQRIGSFRVSAIPLRHPQPTSGFRVCFEDRVVVYATDHEWGDAAIDDRLVREARGADLLIADTHFTPGELDSHSGWGHSSWQQMTQLANRAGVHQLALFHHAPRRSDTELGRILEQARAEFPKTVLARQDEVIQLSDS